MLAKLKISSRLLLMVVLSVVGIASVAGVGLSALKSSLLEDRKDKLQQLVLLAKQALELDYQASRAAGLSDAQALERSKQLLQSLRFGKDDYFYALDMDSVLVAHPNPKFQNKSMKDSADANGVFFSRLQVDLVKSGGSGFVAFSFPRAGVGTHFLRSPMLSDSSPMTGRSRAASTWMTSTRYSWRKQSALAFSSL